LLFSANKLVLASGGDSDAKHNVEYQDGTAANLLIPYYHQIGSPPISGKGMWNNYDNEQDPTDSYKRNLTTLHIIWYVNAMKPKN
jgi:hypothetical protein